MSEACRVALQELVEIFTLAESVRTLGTREADEALDEFARREPLAWDAAKEALAEAANAKGEGA